MTAFVRSQQTPYFQAVLQVNGNTIPAKPGASLMCPANYVYPPLIGNAYQWTEGEGLQSPVVDVELLVRDELDGDGKLCALGEYMMGLFFGRTDPTVDIGFDTASTSITYWDGRTGFTLPNAKAESFTLSTSKNDDIRMSVRFVAAANLSTDPPGDAIQPITEAAPSLISWGNANAMRFSYLKIANQSVATGTEGTPGSTGYLAGRVWTFNMSYANNHTPNMALDGTIYPNDMNAGSPTAGASLMMQAADGMPQDNNPIVVTIQAPVDPVLTRVFTIQNPRNQTPKNRQVGAPRVMRTHQLICLGSAGRDASYTADHQVNGPIEWS